MKKALPLIGALFVAVIICPRRVASHETLTTTVLFDREIVRILDKHCVMCHAERGPAFPLETYEQTWVHGRRIRADVVARHMPPWPAVAGYREFANDNSLTLRETQFMVSWVEGLGPRNAGTVFLNVQDSAGARPKVVRARSDFDRWQLGRPTLTRQLPPTTLAPQRALQIARTTINLGMISARRLRGLEYIPADRRAVRAVFFTLQETGQWLGSWTPWYGFTSLPEGVSYPLPAGSHIVAEIHHLNATEPVVERGTLGLFFDDDARGATPSSVVLEATRGVPARVGTQRLRAATRLARDTYVFALRPEVQAGISSIEVSARSPSGGTEVLLFAKDLSMEWPTPFVFKEPVLLRRGTELSVTGYYANAAATPRGAGIRLTAATYIR